MMAIWGYHLYECFVAFVPSCTRSFLGILVELSQLA